jgi:hypothetical protein
MATKKEIEKELEITLKEIGKITPVYDKRFKEWVFSHELYPVEYAGKTPEEVIKNYPLYLEEFIKHRLDNNLAPSVEKRTKGKGGYRPGAGRPKGTTGEVKKRVYLPEKIADWIRIPEHLLIVEKLSRKTC